MKRKRPLQSLVSGLPLPQQEMIRNTEKHKDEVVNQGLETLREVLADPKRHPYKTHVGDIIVLMAFLEVQKSHSYLLKLAALPDMQVEELIGSALPKHLGVYFYKTCGESIANLKAFVLNKKAYIYCRTAAMQAIVYAAQDGIVKPKEALEFFSTLFTGAEADDPESSFWDEVVQAMCMLYPDNYWHIIRKAIERGLTSINYVDDRYLDKVR